MAKDPRIDAYIADGKNGLRVVQLTSPDTPGMPAPVGRFRWAICGLLFFATTINYIDRQILALIKPILDEQLHWTNEQFGLVNIAPEGTSFTA